MKCICISLLFLGILHQVWAESENSPKFNVLFIAIDDLRTTLGCYGDPIVQSPNIDRLAATGRLFSGAYAQQAVCGPSRASLLTGRLPDTTRVWHNRNFFRDTLPEIVTLPQFFMESGYTTVNLGKVFSGDPREEDPKSWSVPAILREADWHNYFFPENRKYKGKGPSYEIADVPDDDYPDGKLANLALEALSELHGTGKPFFLAVGFFKPHLPFCAPKKYWDLYDRSAFSLEDEISQVAGAPEEAYHTHRELGGYVDMPQDERLSSEQTAILRHGYYACISYIDTQVGKLLDTLEQLGLEDDTIIVLWGDHGFAIGEANRWCKGTNFELDTRVPLIVRLPEMKHAGVATNSLVELVDIYPTLAELNGLKPTGPLDGRSFRPILDDPSAAGRKFVRSQFARPFKKTDPEIMGYSIRTSNHRYGRWIDFESRQTIAEELYDYGDPGSVTIRQAYRIENTNMVSNPALSSVLKDMRQLLDQQLK